MDTFFTNPMQQRAWYSIVGIKPSITLQRAANMLTSLLPLASSQPSTFINGLPTVNVSLRVLNNIGTKLSLSRTWNTLELLLNMVEVMMLSESDTSLKASIPLLSTEDTTPRLLAQWDLVQFTGFIVSISLPTTTWHQTLHSIARECSDCGQRIHPTKWSMDTDECHHHHHVFQYDRTCPSCLSVISTPLLHGTRCQWMELKTNNGIIWICLTGFTSLAVGWLTLHQCIQVVGVPVHSLGPSIDDVDHSALIAFGFTLVPLPITPTTTGTTLSSHLSQLMGSSRLVGLDEISSLLALITFPCPISHFPNTSILLRGPRQSGKTTLLQSVASFTHSKQDFHPLIWSSYQEKLNRSKRLRTPNATRPLLPFERYLYHTTRQRVQSSSLRLPSVVRCAGYLSSPFGLLDDVHQINQSLFTTLCFTLTHGYHMMTVPSSSFFHLSMISPSSSSSSVLLTIVTEEEKKNQLLSDAVTLTMDVQEPPRTLEVSEALSSYYTGHGRSIESTENTKIMTRDGIRPISHRQPIMERSYDNQTTITSSSILPLFSLDALVLLCDGLTQLVPLTTASQSSLSSFLPFVLNLCINMHWSTTTTTTTTSINSTGGDVLYIHQEDVVNTLEILARAIVKRDTTPTRRPPPMTRGGQFNTRKRQRMNKQSVLLTIARALEQLLSEMSHEERCRIRADDAVSKVMKGIPQPYFVNPSEITDYLRQVNILMSNPTDGLTVSITRASWD